MEQEYDEEETDDMQDDSNSDANEVRDMQAAINEQHPFGLKIWKPALYKKIRSVQVPCNFASYHPPVYGLQRHSRQR